MPELKTVRLLIVFALIAFAIAIATTRGLPGLFLVDRECENAQQQYYYARKGISSVNGQIPPSQDKALNRTKDDADVCAQNRMANAAEWSTWLLLGTLVFTGLTFWAAWRTLWSMEDNAKRQLRAYVLVDEMKIREDEGRWLRGKVTFKNFGTTPADKVSQWTGICIRPHPPTEPLPPPTTPSILHAAMGGGGTFNYTFERQFNPKEHEAVLKGEDFRFHVYGTIAYKDIFGDAHDSPFSLYLGHNKESGEHMLIWRATHHDADPKKTSQD